jgi:nitrogen-specific signal transduction histidine kinase
MGGGPHRQNISLESELSDDLGPIIGDRMQLQQVALNIVVNGIGAMTGVTNRPRTS